MKKSSASKSRTGHGSRGTISSGKPINKKSTRKLKLQSGGGKGKKY